jgi:putative ABC transport system permease protein
MPIIDWFKWIFQAVNSNRQRSGLTSLGIAVGIAAVALLTAVGEGVRQYMLDSFSQFGTRIIAVTPGKTSTQGMAGMLNSIKPLSIEDAEQLRKLRHVESVVPMITGTANIESPRFTRNTEVLAVGHEAAAAWRFKVAQGRFLPPDEPMRARPFAVLGNKLKRELFPGQTPLGEFVRVGGQRFQVIGVMESKGRLLGFDLDDVIYIPVHRGLQLFNRESLMEIDIVFKDTTSSAQMAELVRQQLTGLHSREDFTLFTQEDMLNSLDKILSIMTMAVASLGGISLLVGCVGVLTIMTISLRERSSELGLLRALGSSQNQLLMLFLGESMLLASFGGLLGLGSILVIIWIMQWLAPDLPLLVRPVYLLAAWILSLAIGLLAGLYPAWRASRLNPIEAIRQE